MSYYGSTQLKTSDIDKPSEHFQAHDNFMSLRPGIDGKFDYAKRVCILGSSFLSQSFSESGWGYKTSNEIDGFLLTIPHSGFIEWRTYHGLHRVERGVVALTDQIEVFESQYAPGVSYTTLYLSYSDIFKYMALILGHPPRTRIFFQNKKLNAWQAQFTQKITEATMELAFKSPFPLEAIAASLKESLIGFSLYNIPNNFSHVLLDTNSAATPTPHSIKKAVDYMVSSVDPHLTVCEVAAYAGISVRSLQLGFKRFKNNTPIAFLREQRLHRANGMLSKKDSLAHPKDVAFACGFSNYQVFCKYFVQRYGVHPSVLMIRAKDAKDSGSNHAGVTGLSYPSKP